MIGKIIFTLMMISSASASAADSTAIDYSSLQNQFEQKVISRLQLSLDPLLGRDNYTLSLKVTSNLPDTNESTGLFFSKLGFTANLPRRTNYDGYQFENWVTALDVSLAYSTLLSNVDENAVRTHVDTTLKSLGRFKSNVTLSQFTSQQPNSHRSSWSFLPLTPFSIVICGVIVALAFIWSATKIANATAAKSESSKYESATFADPQSEKVNLTPAESLGANGFTSSHSGLEKWQQWMTEDAEAAQLYIERLTRSTDEKDSALLGYILQSTDLKTIRQILPKLKRETLSKIRDLTTKEIDPTYTPVLNLTLDHSITEFIVDQQMDNDHLLKMIHDFSIDECVAVANQNPSSLALYMKYYSTPQMEQIMSRITSDSLNHFLNLPELNKLQLAEIAKKAQNSILEKRQADDSRVSKPIAKWILVASHLELDRERSFYETALRQNSFDEVKNFARENFPQFLVDRLPMSLIKPTLNSFPYNERAELIASFNIETQKKMLELYNQEKKTLEVLEFEIEQIQTDANRKKILQSHAAKLQKDYFNRVRRYIKSSSENLEKAEGILIDWAQDGGKNGQAKPAA